MEISPVADFTLLLKWRDALLVAHRVSSNDFTEDSRRSVLHERERGYAYADRS